MRVLVTLTLCGTAVVFLIVVCMGIGAGFDDKQIPTEGLDPSELTDDDLIQFARSVVRRDLSPKSAGFPDSDDSVARFGDGSYNVSGSVRTVDENNASVKRIYHCSFRWTDDDVSVLSIAYE